MTRTIQRRYVVGLAVVLIATTSSVAVAASATEGRGVVASERAVVMVLASPDDRTALDADRASRSFQRCPVGYRNMAGDCFPAARPSPSASPTQAPPAPTATKPRPKPDTAPANTGNGNGPMVSTGGGCAPAVKLPAGVVGIVHKYLSGCAASALLWIIYHESGGDVHSTNPSSGAYGLPQALPGGKMQSAGPDWRNNPDTQIRWMIGYVNGKYGGAVKAYYFWRAHNWY